MHIDGANHRRGGKSWTLRLLSSAGAGTHTQTREQLFSIKTKSAAPKKRGRSYCTLTPQASFACMFSYLNSGIVGGDVGRSGEK